MRYTLADLGPADESGKEVAMNEQGQVVGTNGRAFLWTNGKKTDLGTL